MKYMITILIFCVSLSAFCCKENVKDNNNSSANNNNSNTNNSNSTQDDAMPDKKYLKEGFINRDTFRVVIVATKDDCESNSDDIKSKANKRAYISLKKKLSARTGTISANTNARLLGLIQKNNEFKQKDDSCKKYNVYYYDIKKRNIKRYLSRIASQR